MTAHLRRRPSRSLPLHAGRRRRARRLARALDPAACAPGSRRTGFTAALGAGAGAARCRRQRRPLALVGMRRRRPRARAAASAWPRSAPRCPRAPITLSTSRSSGAALKRPRWAGCSPATASPATRTPPPPKARLVAPDGRRCGPARSDRGGRGADPRPDQHARLRHGAGRAGGCRARTLAAEFGAQVAVTAGDDLLARELPDDPRGRARLDRARRG